MDKISHSFFLPPTRSPQQTADKCQGHPAAILNQMLHSSSSTIKVILVTMGGTAVFDRSLLGLPSVLAALRRALWAQKEVS